MRHLSPAPFLLASLLAFGVLAPSGVVRADRASAARVAPLVARVLLYERTLAARAGASVDVVVFHSDAASSVAEARGLEEAWTSMGAIEVQGIPVRIRTAPFSTARITQEIAAGADVVVLTIGLETNTAAVVDLARRRRVLTIGTTRTFAQNGTLLAVFIDGDRPRIAVNMAQVRASGTQLSAQLLRLCEVL
jgi:hypothetical protein